MADKNELTRWKDRFLTYIEVEKEREQERQLRLSTEAQLERLRTKLRDLGVDPEA